MTRPQGSDAGDDESICYLLESTESHASARESNSSADPSSGDQLQSTNDVLVTVGKARRLLYISHLLSAWNSRAFEFGAFLFVAAIFPETLLPASVYALTRASAAAILSPYLGSYVDCTDRLSIVRLSIIAQRLAVACSCIILIGLLEFQTLRDQAVTLYAGLALLSVLACVEKLGAVICTVAIERDWVVVISHDDEGLLRTMNSQMRRIDLFCKLVAPLVISFVDSLSPLLAIVVTGSMNLLSVFVEYFAIAVVYKTVPALQAPKHETKAPQPQVPRGAWRSIQVATANTATYFRHSAFLPSFSLALLYLTVLSFSGQMITYLIAIGMDTSLIGVLRGVSALFELSATWIAPRIMERIGAVRSGIWFLNWQIIFVALASLLLWMDYLPAVATVGMVTAVILSRVGLWGFDLSAQIIVQEEVEPELRGAFSSQEVALQNVFEMLSFGSTIVFAKPSQFKYPAALSAGAVALAGALYATFVRSRRGHLLHPSRCMKRHVTPVGVGGRRGWRAVPQDEEVDGSYEMPARTTVDLAMTRQVD